MFDIETKQRQKAFLASLEEHVTEAPEETEVSVEPTDEVMEGDAANLNVSENIELGITLEDNDYARVSELDCNKVIDGYHFDEVSGTYKRYVISGYDASENPAAEPTDNKLQTVILLQNGLVEGSSNGVFVQDLLKVCQNIMEGYQSTQFACEENAEALSNINNAIRVLQSRKQRRTEQGVANTHTPES